MHYLFLICFISFPLFFAPLLSQASSTNNVEVNIIGPFDLAPQKKEYHYGFNENNPESNQYFIELVNGDGKDLRVIDCKKKKAIFKFLCLVENKIVGYIYEWSHVTQAQVKINNKQIIKSNEIDGKGIITKEISLKDQNSIKLKIKGRASSKVQVRIYKNVSDQAPVALFSSAVSNLNSSQINFDASLSSDNGSIVNYDWDFGDGLTGNGVQVSHVYSASGNFNVTLMVTDNVGLTSQISKPIVISSNQPPIANIQANTLNGEAPLMVMFNGSGSSDPDGDSLTYSWDFNDGNISSGAMVSNLFQNPGNYNVVLTVTDSKGLSNSTNVSIVASAIVLPPDPAQIAPPLPIGDANGLLESISFLYTSNPPVQRNVSSSIINQNTVAWLRGKVLDRQGQPLSGFKVSVLNHPEFGFTYTRTDGYYDMAVNGGMTYVLNFVNMAYLPIQRSVKADPKSSIIVEDVVATALDAKVLPLSNNISAPQTLVGSVSSDLDGQRTPVLYIPPQSLAEIILPNGTKQTLPNLNIRLTEYTVGEFGEKAMPGTLPPTTNYTYALEISSDEAIALGSNHIQFNKPVSFYINNFVNVPVGIVIPFGYYDTVAGMWKGERNGLSVKVIDIINGEAILDLDNSGVRNQVLEQIIGIDSNELIEIAKIYQINEGFWRVQTDHFSAFDLNIYFRPQGDPNLDFDQSSNNNDHPTCTNGGSFFEMQKKTFGESLPIHGTSFNLVYKSNRTRGYKKNSEVTANLTSYTADIVEGRLKVAGVEIVQGVANPSGENKRVFSWDGNDVFGRNILGLQKVDFEMSTINLVPQYNALSIATLGVAARGISAAAAAAPSYSYEDFVSRSLFTIIYDGESTAARKLVSSKNTIKRSTYLGILDWRTQGFGGWNIDIHHSFNPTANRIYFGDGSERIEADDYVEPLLRSCFNKFSICDSGLNGNGDGGSSLDAAILESIDLVYLPSGELAIGSKEYDRSDRIRVINNSGVINTLAGSGSNATSENISASQVKINNLRAVNRLPSGEIIYAENSRIRKISLSNTVSTISGSTVAGNSSGDGTLAINATFNDITDLAVGSDGSIFVSDSYYVRKIAPDGTIDSYAGRLISQGVIPFNAGFAKNVDFSAIVAIDVDPSGNLFIADVAGVSIVEIKTDGLIQFVAGAWGQSFEIGDGGKAINARFKTISDIAVDNEGSIYVSKYGQPTLETVSIRKITPDRFIFPHVGVKAGNLFVLQPTNEGVPANDYYSYSVSSLGIDPNNRLIFGEESKVSRVNNIFSMTLNNSVYEIPSDDGSEIYHFDLNGRHLKTVRALTKSLKYLFNYTNNYLSSIEDGDGKITQFVRGFDGSIEKIISSYGVETLLSTDSNGYLSQMMTPNNDSYQFSYTSGGLLTDIAKPDNLSTHVDYDLSSGEMVKDTDALGGFFEFMLGTAPDRSILTTSNGRKKDVQTKQISNQYIITRDIDYDGTTTSYIREGQHNFTQKENHFDQELVSQQDPFLKTNFINRLNSYIPLNGNFTKVERKRSLLYSDPLDPQSNFVLTDLYIENDVDTTRHDFNSANKTYTMTSPEGRVSQIKINQNERPTEFIFPSVNSTLVGYDNFGRINTVTQGSRVTQYFYDNKGYLNKVINAEGEQTIFSNDLNGNILTQELNDGRIIEFDYTAHNLLSGVKPSGKMRHQLNYNRQNLLLSYVPPSINGLSTPTQFEYNLDKDLIGITRADNKTINFNYTSGAKRELASQVSTDGQINYSYDAEARPIQIQSEDNLSMTLSYSGARVAYYSIPNVGEYSRQFNNKQLIDLDTYQSGHVYDKDGLLIGLGGGRISINRSSQSGFIDSVYYSSSSALDEYTYNSYGEISSYKFSNLSLPQFTKGYLRDRLGRITSTNELTNSTVYTYDTTGRLKTVSDMSGLTTYNYDSNSNITQVISPSGTISATYDEQDRLLTFGNNTYLYNNHGELNSKTDSILNEITNYTYDSYGNLKSVNLPDGNNIQYKVDGFNRRSVRLKNGVVTDNFIYKDQLNPVQVTKADGTQQTYFYATKLNVPDMMEINNQQTYKIVSDHLGSVRMVINLSNQQIEQKIEYDAYGKVLSDTNPGFQPFGFAGGIYDHETGLTRFGARDYDAEIGRFTTKDPIGFAGGDTNLYAYVGNNPVNRIDPTGTVVIDLTGGSGPRTPAYNNLNNNPNATVLILPNNLSDGYYGNTNGIKNNIIIDIDSYTNRFTDRFNNTFAHELEHAQQIQDGRYNQYDPNRNTDPSGRLEDEARNYADKYYRCQ